jgi:tRNA threonylcarbamoyladenosine biosynthesis protein TsaB
MGPVRILAVDTTTARGSVALADGDDVVAEVRFTSSDRHSTHVLPAVEFLLKSAGWDAAAPEGYAVTIGPGSFTGLRIGLSTVQGLALASERPCLGISSLDVLASRIAGSADSLVALVDARRDQVYVGFYDGSGSPRGGPRLDSLAGLLPDLPPAAAYAGDAAARCRGEIAALRPASVFPDRGPFLAGALARLAAARFAAGASGSAGELRPLYLRGADTRGSSAR